MMIVIVIVIVVASLFNVRIDYVFIFVNDDTIAFDTYSIHHDNAITETNKETDKFILLHSVKCLFVFDLNREMKKKKKRVS